MTVAIYLDLATAAPAHKWTGKRDCLRGRAVNPKIGGKSWNDAKPKSHAVGHVSNMQLACPRIICDKDDDWLPRVQVRLRPRLPSPHLRSRPLDWSFLFFSFLNPSFNSLKSWLFQTLKKKKQRYCCSSSNLFFLYNQHTHSLSLSLSLSLSQF